MPAESGSGRGVGSSAPTAVSGLTLLKYLTEQTPERLGTIAVPGAGINMTSFPAMLPVTSHWPAVLGKALRTDGAKERAVALTLFGIPAESLRIRARELTVPVARILKMAGGEYQRVVEWRLDSDPGGEWEKWCGGVA